MTEKIVNWDVSKNEMKRNEILVFTRLVPERWKSANDKKVTQTDVLALEGSKELK